MSGVDSVEWDEAKNLSNQQKHGLSFEEAAEVFRDPLQVSVHDRIEDGEERWQTFGIVRGLLLVMWPIYSAKRIRRKPWSVSSPHGVQIARKGGSMKTKTVSCTLGTLPPLTEAQEVHLKALEARPESKIDYSDIPALTEDQLKYARRGVFYRPVKHQITARVDADVLDWLKAQGKGYQSRINAILRREMLAASKQG